jgi:hypothetical protein
MGDTGDTRRSGREIPEKYGEMRKGHLWREIRGRYKEILGSFWEI